MGAAAVDYVKQLEGRVADLEAQLAESVAAHSRTDMQAHMTEMRLTAERDGAMAAHASEQALHKATMGRLEQSEASILAERQTSARAITEALAAAAAKGAAEGRLSAMMQQAPVPAKPGQKGWKVVLEKDELGATRSFSLEPRTS